MSKVVNNKEKIKIEIEKNKKNLLIELEISNNNELIIQNILEFCKKNNLKIIKLIELLN